jgi:hypothetical protein
MHKNHVQVDHQRAAGRDARMAFGAGMTRFDRFWRKELHVSPLPGARFDPVAFSLRSGELDRIGDGAAPDDRRKLVLTFLFY